MTRIKINARRIFSLLIPFFFFTSVHAEQTAAPAKTVTVEAKNETFAPQHPDQYLSWKAASEQSERVDALAEDPRLNGTCGRGIPSRAITTSRVDMLLL